MRRWSYDQSAIICTIRHTEPNKGVAVEHFLPNGPFAVLPMTDNRCSIVWSEKTSLVDTYLKVRAGPEENFLAAYRRLGKEPFKEALYGAA